MKIFVSLIGLSIATICKGEYTCLSCKDVPSPRDCNLVERCGQYGECFTEQYVFSTGHIRYTLGCRDTAQCQSGAFIGKRQSSGGHTICRECCTGDLCNNRGCKQQGYPQPADRGPVCFSCPKELSPDSCDEIQICRKGDVCKVKGGVSSQIHEVRYELKCERKETCYGEVQFLQTPGAGSSHFVEIGSRCIIGCCDSDLCNAECNGTTRTVRNFCDPNPCVHGTCFSNQNGFVCKCNLGYTGTRCETVHNFCESQPCAHGRCHSDTNGFLCTCDPGYTGSKCDKIKNFCDPQPCVHGTCSSTLNKFVCTCDPGYTGSRCETVKNYCDPSPCAHGTCFSNKNGFVCTCQPGYTGSRCETVKNPCQPNPCGHGSCHSSRPNTYVCRCHGGYVGSRCQTTGHK